jgi:hypothetical protein
VTAGAVLWILALAVGVALAAAAVIFKDEVIWWTYLFWFGVAVIGTCVVFLGLILLRRQLVLVRRAAYDALVLQLEAAQAAHESAETKLAELLEGGAATASATTADVRVRVHRAIRESGNAAGESWRRWLHLQAENWSDIVATNVTVGVHIRPLDLARDWRWTGARDHIKQLKRGLPVAIPIVAGDIAEPPASRDFGIALTHAHLKIGSWFFTPEASLTERTIEVGPGRYWLDVTVSWDGGSASDSFVVDLPAAVNRTTDATLTHTVANDLY